MTARALFTPRTREGRRLRMRLSPGDMVKIKRGCRWTADVTDLKTGRRYKVRDAGCGSLHCHCDALVVREIPRSRLSIAIEAVVDAADADIFTDAPEMQGSVDSLRKAIRSLQLVRRKGQS